MKTIEEQKKIINQTLNTMYSQPGSNIAIRSHYQCIELHRMQDAAGVQRSEIGGFIVK